MQQHNSEQAKLIELGKIELCAFQPRKTFAPDKLQELAESIQQQGLIQPIVVRPCAQSHNYELVAGERRLRAVTSLNWDKIPALIRDYSDAQVQQIALIENIQRQNLNPIEEAQALQSLLNSLQVTQEQLAKQLGKSRTAISNCLRLLALPSYIQEKLQVGLVSVGQVRPLLAINNSKVQYQLWQELLERQLSAREVEKLVRTQKAQVPKPKCIDIHLQQVEEQLIAHLGTKVKIQGNQQQGKIEISYYSLVDLEQLLESLLAGK